MATVSLALWNMRVTALDETRENVKNLGIATTEQTFRSIQGIDLVLQATQNAVRNSGITNTAQFNIVLARSAAHAAMQRAMDGLPQFQAFIIAGADGRQIDAASQTPLSPLDVSKQGYYRFLSSHDSSAALIGTAKPDSARGTMTIYLVRRIDTASGTFLGLALGEIDLRYFDNFYQQLVGDNTLSILLLDRPDSAFAVAPVSGGVGTGKLPQDSAWYGVAGSGPPGVANRWKPASPRAQISALNKVAEYPFAVAVTESEHAALANWRHALLLTSLAVAGAGFWTLLLLRALIVQLRRLEQSEASLSRQNAALLQVEGRMRYLADHDELTKLINRRVFRTKLEEALALADRTSGRIAVFYLDLDRFKSVNDIMGHGAGDRLLIEVTALLQGAVNGRGTIARTGGDEFAIITADFSDVAAVSEFGKTLLDLFKTPFTIDGRTCHVSGSMGIVLYPEHGSDAHSLLANASTALYRAKEDGPDQLHVFDAEMDIRQQQLFVLEQALKQAIELAQFELDYQPIVESTTKRIICCEALLRWRHPEHGMVSPADFIELAENTGLIIPIGRWVLACACAEVAQWPDDIRIIVNLSPAQFNDTGLIDFIQETLHQTNLPATRLVLEVTEGLLLQKTKTVLDTMHRLRRLGIQFSLDDFGTGHSGLGYLQQFPFDNIKIDKLFIRDMVRQPQARAIVSALLAVGNALGLTVVAEGVETEAQLAELISLHCKYVQGFGIGRPQPAQQVRKLFTKNHADEIRPLD